jgi:hypothetical protein
MKTKPSARWIVRVRALMLVLAIAVSAAIEFKLGGYLASRTAQASVSQNDMPPVPAMDLSVLVAAAH